MNGSGEQAKVLRQEEAERQQARAQAVVCERVQRFRLEVAHEEAHREICRDARDHAADERQHQYLRARAEELGDLE